MSHAEPVTPNQPTSTGIDPPVAGVLAYLFGWVSGLILYLIEKDHREVRFHAAQSILLSAVVLVGYIGLFILGFIPLLGLLFWFLELVLALAAIGLWVYMMIQAYHQRHVRLPVIGPMAEQWAAKQTTTAQDAP